MSGPLKKQRAVFPIEEYVEEVQDEFVGQKIDVEFEGFRADDGDFHGIKRLLSQTFRGLDDVDISGMSDIVISQSYVGSVIKQVCDDEDDKVEMETEEDPLNQEVFGVTTIINLNSRKDEASIAGLRTALVEKCGECAADATNQMLRELLGHESKHIGLLISERFVNLPSQFALPVFESLKEEVDEANKDNMPYNFTHLLMICKVYKLKGKKKKKNQGAEEEMWSNPEEEIFAEECISSFEYKVKGDTGLSGDWDDDDAQYVPWRRVLLLSADKLPSIIAKVYSVL